LQSWDRLKDDGVDLSLLVFKWILFVVSAVVEAVFGRHKWAHTGFSWMRELRKVGKKGKLDWIESRQW
jgi:hypothetical protein